MTTLDEALGVPRGTMIDTARIGVAKPDRRVFEAGARSVSADLLRPVTPAVVRGCCAAWSMCWQWSPIRPVSRAAVTRPEVSSMRRHRWARVPSAGRRASSCSAAWLDHGEG